MLKLCVSLVYLSLIISGVLAIRQSNSTKTTTANPFSDLFSKFHQNDYKVAYEWSEVVRTDKIFGDYQAHTFKYNRTTTVTNVTFISNVNMGYDVEAIIQAYKFASNEYRLFPLRFQFNLCVALTEQAMGFGKFSTLGNFSCPILKGKLYHYYNWTPEEATYPPFIPAGKYMLETQFLYHSKEFLVTRGYGAVYRPTV